MGFILIKRNKKDRTTSTINKIEGFEKNLFFLMGASSILLMTSEFVFDCFLNFLNIKSAKTVNKRMHIKNMLVKFI